MNKRYNKIFYGLVLGLLLSAQSSQAGWFSDYIYNPVYGFVATVVQFTQKTCSSVFSSLTSWFVTGAGTANTLIEQNKNTNQPISKAMSNNNPVDTTHNKQQLLYDQISKKFGGQIKENVINYDIANTLTNSKNKKNLNSKNNFKKKENNPPAPVFQQDAEYVTSKIMPQNSPCDFLQVKVLNQFHMFTSGDINSENILVKPIAVNIGGGGASCGHQALVNGAKIAQALIQDAQQYPQGGKNHIAQVLNTVGVNLNSLINAADYIADSPQRKILDRLLGRVQVNNNNQPVMGSLRQAIITRNTNTFNNMTQQAKENAFVEYLKKSFVDRIVNTEGTVLNNLLKDMSIVKTPAMENRVRKVIAAYREVLNYLLREKVRAVMRNQNQNQDQQQVYCSFTRNEINQCIQNTQFNDVLDLKKLNIMQKFLNLSAINENQRYTEQQLREYKVGNGDWIEGSDIEYLARQEQRQGGLLHGVATVVFSDIDENRLQNRYVEDGMIYHINFPEANNLSQLKYNLNHNNTITQLCILGTMGQTGSLNPGGGHWISLVIHKRNGQTYYIVADSMNSNRLIGDPNSNFDQNLVFRFKRLLESNDTQEIDQVIVDNNPGKFNLNVN